MTYDCPRCWNTGVYFPLSFARYLRCQMCNANFGDPRSGPEIAASIPIEAVPYDTISRRQSVASLEGRNNFCQRMYERAIQEREEHSCMLSR